MFHLATPSLDPKAASNAAAKVHDPGIRWVGGVAFRPDGAQLAAAGTRQTIALWSFARGKLERTLEAPMGSGFALSYNHAGTRLAFAGSDRSARIFDLKKLTDPLILSDHEEGIASIAFSHDDKWIATGGGDPLEIIQTPIGKFARAGTENRTIRLWDSATGAERKTLPGPIGSIHAVAFSPDDEYLVSAGADGSVRVWSLETCEALFSLKEHNSPLLALALSPDGTRIAAGGEDRTISIWDTGRLVHTLEGHTNFVMGLAFSPDGRRLASAGADQTVRIWDATSGGALLTLGGAQDRVHAVAFSPDGKSLAAASADGQVRVWESVPASEVRQENRDQISDLPQRAQGQ